MAFEKITNSLNKTNYIRKIKPYFQDDNIVLYNADCLEILIQLSDNCIDIILTDPPYGIHDGVKTGFLKSRYDKRGTGKNQVDELIELNKWDKLPDKIIFDEIFRTSNNQILWGFQYYLEYLKNSKEIWIWDKQTGKSFFADAEMAWTSYQGTTRIFQHQWCGCFKPDRNENSLHPTMKPLELFKWCLRKAKKDDLILDCFAGSGTTAEAIIDINQESKLNLSCILVEKEKKYCDIIVKRLKLKNAIIKNQFYLPEENNLFQGV